MARYKRRGGNPLAAIKLRMNKVTINEELELAIGGTFSDGIVGYVARAASVISWNSIEESLFCDISGVGGGFIADFGFNDWTSKTYEISIDIKGISYFGGFKVRLGTNEKVLTESITGEYQTYTVEITGALYNLPFEIFRSAAETGQLSFDNLSIKEKQITTSGPLIWETGESHWVDEDNLPWTIL